MIKGLEETLNSYFLFKIGMCPAARSCSPGEAGRREALWDNSSWWGCGTGEVNSLGMIDFCGMLQSETSQSWILGRRVLWVGNSPSAID